MPLTDEEVEQLKADTKAARAEAKAAAKAQAEQAQMYQADMRIIGDKLFNQQQAPAAPVAQAAPDEDDGELNEAKVEAMIQQRVNAPANAIMASNLATSRQLASITIPGFNRYAQEVDQLVGRAIQANPGAAADPTLYRNAFDVVRLNHQDEIVTERAQAEVRRRLIEAGVVDEEDDEVATAASEATTEATPAPRQAPARQFAEAPTAPVMGRALPPIKKRGRLSDEQSFVNSKLGFTANDKFDEYADSRYSPDILGLKGRERV